jgi:hypothetical protein
MTIELQGGVGYTEPPHEPVAEPVYVATADPVVTPELGPGLEGTRAPPEAATAPEFGADLEDWAAPDEPAPDAGIDVPALSDLPVPVREQPQLLAQLPILPVPAAKPAQPERPRVTDAKTPVGAQAPDGRALQGDLVRIAQGPAAGALSAQATQWGLKGTTVLYRVPVSIQDKQKAIAYVKQKIEYGGWAQLRALDPRNLGGAGRGPQTARYVTPLRQRVDLASQEITRHEREWAALANTKQLGQGALDALRQLASGRDRNGFKLYENSRNELLSLYSQVVQRQVNTDEGQRRVQALLTNLRAEHQQRIAQFGANAQSGAAVTGTASQLASTAGAWVIGSKAFLTTGSPAAAAAAAADFSASNRMLQTSVSTALNRLTNQVRPGGPDKDLERQLNPLTRERLLREGTGVATDSLQVGAGAQAVKVIKPLAAPLTARATAFLRGVESKLETPLADLFGPRLNGESIAVPQQGNAARARFGDVSTVAAALRKTGAILATHGVRALKAGAAVTGHLTAGNFAFNLVAEERKGPKIVPGNASQEFAALIADPDYVKKHYDDPLGNVSGHVFREPLGDGGNRYLVRVPLDLYRELRKQDIAAQRDTSAQGIVLREHTLPGGRKVPLEVHPPFRDPSQWVLRKYTNSQDPTNPFNKVAVERIAFGPIEGRSTEATRSVFGGTRTGENEATVHAEFDPSSLRLNSIDLRNQVTERFAAASVKFTPVASNSARIEDLSVPNKGPVRAIDIGAVSGYVVLGVRDQQTAKLDFRNLADSGGIFRATGLATPGLTYSPVTFQGRKADDSIWAVTLGRAKAEFPIYPADTRLTFDANTGRGRSFERLNVGGPDLAVELHTRGVLPNPLSPTRWYQLLQREIDSGRFGWPNVAAALSKRSAVLGRGAGPVESGQPLPPRTASPDPSRRPGVGPR